MNFDFLLIKPNVELDLINKRILHYKKMLKFDFQKKFHKSLKK